MPNLPETIVIPIFMICAIVFAAIGIPVGWMCGRWLSKRIKESRQKKRTELKKMLPEPWLTAYDQCRVIKGHLTRALWLKTWLKRRPISRGLSPPVLSVQAANKFAKMVAASSTDYDFRDAFEDLSPFLEFPSSGVSVTAVLAELAAVTTATLKRSTQPESHDPSGEPVIAESPGTRLETIRDSTYFVSIES